MKKIEIYYSFVSKNIDKIAHAAVSTILLVALTLLLHKVGISNLWLCRAFAMIITYGFGVIKEVIDEKKMSEIFDKKDIIADIIGIVIGILITFLI